MPVCGSNTRTYVRNKTYVLNGLPTNILKYVKNLNKRLHFVICSGPRKYSDLNC